MSLLPSSSWSSLGILLWKWLQIKENRFFYPENRILFRYGLKFIEKYNEKVFAMNENLNILFPCVHIHSCRTQWMLKMKWNYIANLHFTLSLFLLLLKSKLLSQKCLYLRSMHLYCDLMYHRLICTYQCSHRVPDADTRTMYYLIIFFRKYRK